MSQNELYRWVSKCAENRKNVKSFEGGNKTNFSWNFSSIPLNRFLLVTRFQRLVASIVSNCLVNLSWRNRDAPGISSILSAFYLHLVLDGARSANHTNIPLLNLLYLRVLRGWSRRCSKLNRPTRRCGGNRRKTGERLRKLHWGWKNTNWNTKERVTKTETTHLLKAKLYKFKFSRHIKRNCVRMEFCRWLGLCFGPSHFSYTFSKNRYVYTSTNVK